MKTKLLLLFCLITLQLTAQERKTLQGRVTASDNPLSGVYVTNKYTGAEVTTDAKGNFSIPARKGDRLVVHSRKTEQKEFYIDDAAFKNMPYTLAVVVPAVEIEEVVVTDTVKINDPTIDSKAAYTPAERRANMGAKVKPRAMDTTWQSGGGIAVPLDAVWNGGEKRKLLRRELQTEQLQKNITGISAIYSNEQITNELGIPADMVPAFLYYAAEDEGVATALKENNAERVKMQLPVVAIEYMELQQEETAPPETTPKNR